MSGKEPRCGWIHSGGYIPPIEGLAYGYLKPVMRCKKKACHKGKHKWVVHDFKERDTAVYLDWVLSPESEKG